MFLQDIFILFVANSVDMCFDTSDPTPFAKQSSGPEGMIFPLGICFQCYIQWSLECIPEIKNAVYIHCLICIRFYKLKFEKTWKF